jgi:uncharacterized protein YidB (DUF937 family)
MSKASHLLELALWPVGAYIGRYIERNVPIDDEELGRAIGEVALALLAQEAAE